MHKALLAWFKKNGRHALPWRQTSNAYHIYLSEIMLQQTQVSRVQEHFYPLFLKHYPTIKDLANASLEDILSHWSGLGYYNRARNLHKAAQVLQKSFPETKKELLKLPGIGEYTASAIASFAFNESVAVVDTNIKRVLQRLFNKEKLSNKEALALASKFLNLKNPKEHNLALMDLGATVCTAKEAKCALCPLEPFCKGKSEIEKFLQQTKQKRVQKELHFALNLNNNKVALTPSSGSMYKNMLLLPSPKSKSKLLGSYKHSYTKYNLTIYLYKSAPKEQNLEWVEVEEFLQAPIPTLIKKAYPFIKELK